MPVSIHSNHKFVVVVCGPTASGKTALSIQLAKYFETEIINSDSRQIYNELNIGVAKPDSKALATVKHHLIGTKSISNLYGAGDFEKEAIELITNLHKKHNIVIVTGGTGLYLKALYNGLDDLPGADENYRKQLNTIYINNGIDALRKLLIELDADALKSIDQSNPQRIMRALEIIKLSGKRYNEVLISKQIKRDFKFIKIGVHIPREILYSNINKRVDVMMKQGLLEEVKSLIAFKKLNALKTVGYSELLMYLNNEISLVEAVNKIKQHTRNYAKRQITWFKSDKEITWFSPNDVPLIIEHIKKITA